MTYIFEAYVVSTIIVWIIFWLMLRQFKEELLYYYNFTDDTDVANISCLDVYSESTYEQVKVIIILLLPLINICYLIYYMLGDHLDLLANLALSYGAVARTSEEMKDNKGE
jgi:hypothetical protein